jgi:hypothetical protein
MAVIGLSHRSTRSNIKGKSWLFILSLGLLLLIFGMRLSTVHAQAVSIDSVKNCDANSVIWCGASSVSDLVDKYDNGDGHNTSASIQAIYSYYGISQADITAMNTNNEKVEVGSVSASGNVYDADEKVVATNAVTAGRENISGSTEVNSSGTVFYSRPTSVSFLSSSLPAYVVMKNGQFLFAVLASCGNPIKATLKTQPAPTPTPAPTPIPAPTPKPVIKTTTPKNTCSGNTLNVNSGVASQGGNCSTNTTVVQTPTTPAPSGECTSLQINVDQTSPLIVSATANSQVENGAQLSSVVFNFGDGSITQPNTDITQQHSYASPGNYTITATETFSNGTQAIASSNCEALITMATAASTPVTTPTVTTAVATTPTSNLVNTGPGNLIELFGAAVILSTLAYREVFVKRYLNRD